MYKNNKNNYKKLALFSMLICAFSQYASELDSCLNSWLEIKPSYFFFSASPMKNIYKSGGFEFQASVSVPVHNYLDVYGSIGYRKASGCALNSCEKTRLTVMPIDIGLKPVFNFCERFYYFFAVGPRYFYFNQHNYSPYVDCKVNGSNIGFFVNTGFNSQLSNCILLGIFGEYSYEKKKICSNRLNVYSNGPVQIGGFAFGVNLGYVF